ncbi:hypothetical protein ABH37_17505 [Mycobacterium haemophilum]|uniref:PPE domain-containing protein n=2 Tax=Mycobacterium haemophilum TaxID=29311 RepID=A0A0I9TC80_9MYCO|nr:hypothetical protein ABH39_16960 [Mycobacterium haemophilum]KLO34882.1 hypothetical protein ABH38_17685 [Mycobacterium haemophilum]KLO39864.1 hypothetical protein ABH37_17505 [Mycobacterium haemophilum]KLO46904.1 hypothetical protein ABH36_17615 [Mycobacterium haemophilum]
MHYAHYAEYCKLKPEINSKNIRDGVGTESLDLAGRQWEIFATHIEAISIALDRWLTALQGEWSGPAAQRMIETVEQSRQWLDRFVIHLRSTGDATERISRAYATAYDAMVPMTQIEENRREWAQAAKMAAVDSAAAHRVQQLDEQYEEFCATDVTAMTSYDNVVYEALASLPSWEPPPAAGDMALPVGWRLPTAR